MTKEPRHPKAQDTVGRRRRSAPWLLGGGIALLAAIVVGVYVYRAAADHPGQRFPDQGNRHVQTFSEAIPPYNSDPPTSGPHMPYIAPWGIHTEPIPRQLQVHNLEDGGVMVQYNCDCPDVVAKLRDIVSTYDRHVILAPYPGMKSRIALTAWTRIETLDALAPPEGDEAWTRLDAFDEVDESRIRRFIRAYRGIDHHPG